ncbi:MAG: hypothetical protein K2P80_05505 [Beijerinckiaceae bacterium]|nr:hypothetical protein [Beijerinckiaceae bacterium]
MIFLNRNDVEKRKASLQRKVVGNPKPVFHYESNPAHDYLSAARAFVASLGEFREATLLAIAFPFGDGWQNQQIADPRWARFRGWRESHGEVNRLHDVPGQQFALDEIKALAEVIAFTLELGWDAYLDADRGRKLIVFSHDDRVEIHRGCERRTLIQNLLRLGYWRIAGAP